MNIRLGKDSKTNKLWDFPHLGSGSEVVTNNLFLFWLQDYHFGTI